MHRLDSPCYSGSVANVNGLAERIKLIREHIGLSRRELADRLGLSYEAVSKYESGERTPDCNMVSRIASIGGVTADWLLGRSPAAVLLSPGRTTSGVARVPLVRRFQPGLPLAEHEILEFLGVSETAVGSGICFYLMVDDRSMEPTLRPGGMVLISCQSFCDDGEIALISLRGDEPVLRRIYRSGDAIAVKADNPESETVVMPASAVRVLGVVTAYTLLFTKK